MGTHPSVLASLLSRCSEAYILYDRRKVNYAYTFRPLIKACTRLISNLLAYLVQLEIVHGPQHPLGQSVRHLPIPQQS